MKQTLIIFGIVLIIVIAGLVFLGNYYSNPGSSVANPGTSNT